MLKNSFIKLNIHSSLLKQVAWNLQESKMNSTYTNKYREEAIVTSDDGNIIVCWHPEPIIPYELTKQIPESEVNTELKLDINKAKEQFRKDHPYFVMKKLQEITYTNKHIWFPRPKDKMIKFKEKEPKDREYL